MRRARANDARVRALLDATSDIQIKIILPRLLIRWMLRRHGHRRK